LEIDEPVTDFSGENVESEPDYTGNESDSETDNAIGEENSDEASNPTQSFLKKLWYQCGWKITPQ
jgi:hypothetical protein